MRALTQLEKDYEKAKQRGARSELLKKLENQISRQKIEKPRDKKVLSLKGEDSFELLYKKAVDEINKRYIDGTDDYIRKFHPDLYQQIDDAENKLNEVWKAGLEGKAEIEEFRDVLKQWFRLHVRSIEIYSKEHKKEEARLNEK